VTCTIKQKRKWKTPDITTRTTAITTTTKIIKTIATIKRIKTVEIDNKRKNAYQLWFVSTQFR
jgi:hypothetical protein